MGCLYIFEMNPLLVTLFVKIFSYSVGCLCFLMVSFAVQKLVSLIRCPLFIFVFIFFILGNVSQKDTAVIYVRECLAYVFP